LHVSGSAAETIDTSGIPLTGTLRVTSLEVATLISKGVRVGGDHTCGCNQTSIDLTYTGSQLVIWVGAPETAEVATASVLLRSRGLAAGGVVVAEERIIVAKTATAVRADAVSQGSGIRSSQAGAQTIIDRVIIATASSGIAEQRAAEGRCLVTSGTSLGQADGSGTSSHNSVGTALCEARASVGGITVVTGSSPVGVDTAAATTNVAATTSEAELSWGAKCTASSALSNCTNTITTYTLTLVASRDSNGCAAATSGRLVSATTRSIASAEVAS
jgi:hypothetical protein